MTIYLKELKICLGFRGCEFDVLIPYNIQILRASQYGPAEVDIDFDRMLSPKSGKPISKRLYDALLPLYEIDITETMQQENW